MRRRKRLCVEPLEPRFLLAGDVTADVHGGNLFVRGDDLANAFEIAPGTAPGEFAITGLSAGGAPTTVNGKAAVIVSGVARDLRINTRSGDDFVRLRQLTILDDLIIKSNGGDDTFTVADTTVRDRFEIKSGHGADLIQLVGSTIGGDARIKTRHGSDVIRLIDTEIGDDLRIDTRRGHDQVVLLRATVADDAGIETNRGDDHVCLQDSSFGELEVELGRGHDRLDTIGSWSAEEAEFDGGRGQDTLALDDTNEFGELELEDFESTVAPTPCVIDDGPILTMNEGATIAAGGTITLTPEMLSARSFNSPPEEIVYTLIEGGYTGLFTGYVAFADAPDAAIPSFTQADVNAGRVIYRDGIGGNALPELKADSFLFSVADGAGGESGSRSFLILRDLPEFGPADGTTIWRLGDGNAFIDGGPGDDAFVLRGTDGDDVVVMRPSTDGTQIVMTVNGSETVTLDGFEDIYFMMGNGSNLLDLGGDFSQTDLTPSTVVYRGGSEDDTITDENGSAIRGGTRYDFVITLGPGDNFIKFKETIIRELTNARATFIIGGPEFDDITVEGVQGYQQQVFAGGGQNHISVFPNSQVHIDEFAPVGSTNITVFGAGGPGLSQNIYYVDFNFISQLYRVSDSEEFPPPDPSDDEEFEAYSRGWPILDRGSGQKDGLQSFSRNGTHFLVHEPVPGGIEEAADDIQSALDAFLIDPTDLPFPTPAYAIPPDRTSYLTPDPANNNAMIGFELSAAAQEALFGADFDDILFAGDNLDVADADLPPFLSLESDRLFGMGGDDWMVGDRLNNFFDGGTGNDHMEGQRGDDTFDGGLGDDLMEGQEGQDLFLWSFGFDLIDGGPGIDRASYETDPDPSVTEINVIATPDGYRVEYEFFDGGIMFNADTLVNIEEVVGTVRGDTMHGGMGNDGFFGGPGDDTLEGHGANDHLDGGFGDDTIDGGADDDTLDGGPGADQIDGGPGDDIITDQIGNNTLLGGPGNDLITGGGVTIDGGPGNDILLIEYGNTVNGGAGDDEISVSAGNGGPQTIDGGPGRDEIDASFGDDMGIFRLGDVGVGNDFYNGGPGTDMLRIVIPDPASLSPAEFNELLNVQNFFAGGALGLGTFNTIQLTIIGWEKLEIVDRAGNPFVTPQAPTDIFLSGDQVQADDPEAFIGLLTVEDANPGDTHTFDLSDSRFDVLAGNRLFLATGVSLPPGTDPILLTIGATDQGGLRFEKTFTITVVFEPLLPPTDILLSNVSFREESLGQAVGFIDVVDPNSGDFHTFTIDDPASPAPRFEIVGGILKLIDTATIDFETEPSVTINITAEDNAQLSFSKQFTLTVIDIDESAAGFPAAPGDLDGTNGFEFTNGASNGRLGISISSDGDVNGDGLDDILATSYFDPNTFPVLNDFAYLIPGGASLPARITSADLAARGGTVFTLPSAGQINGVPNAAHIGDFNGDGYGDVVLGASGVNGGNGVLAGGQVYVVLGQAGGLPPSIDLTNPATFDGATAFRIDGGNIGDKIGTTLGSAGDIDGDGFDDALIGFRLGGAVIVYGGPGPFPATQVSDSIVDLRSTLINPQFSDQVAAIRDLNGDGYDDIFAGIHPQFSTFSTSGAILFGQPGGLAAVIDPSQTQDVLIGGGAFRSIGDTPGGVGPAGDVNRDGFEDIFLVTNAEGAPTPLSNEIIVLYGGETFPTTIDLGDNDGSGPGGASPIAFLAGGLRGVQIVPGGNLGRTVQVDTSFAEGVVAAGDTNGDGNDDLLVRVTNTSTGDVMHSLIFGHPLLPGTLVMDPTNFSPQQGKDVGFIVRPGFGFTPDLEGSGYHQGLAGTGDINGDGFSDVIMGDPFGEPAAGFADAGLDYVLFGDDLSGLVAPQGSTGDDFLLANTSDDLLIGGQGNDTLVGQRGRNVFYGGIGDDLIVVTGLGFAEYARIDGGGGRDTLRLAGDDLVWDLGTTGNSNTNPAGNHLVQSIEVIDLGRGGSTDSHTLILSREDLVDLPGQGRSLTIIGDASDTLSFGGLLTFNRSEIRQGILMDIYTVDGLFNFELIVAADLLLST